MEFDALKPARNFLKLFDQLEQIVNSGASWELKFDLVFDAGLCQSLLGEHHFEWYDPDRDYEDDVRAFYEAAREVAEDMRRLFDSPEG